MRVNPFLRKLGFTAADRVIVIHADDVGMCDATLPAARELFAAETISSASLMVPCPSFSEAARLASAIPNGDFGVHLTLTSEWTSYRWRPLSTGDPRSGLVDGDGYLWNLRGAVAAHAGVAAVVTEMRAQVEHARAAGVDVTHLDAHMLTAMDARYMAAYADLGRELGLPVLLPRTGLQRHNFDDEACALAKRVADEWEGDGLPLFDALELMGLGDDDSDRMELAKRKIDALPRGGLGMLLLHPAVPSAELSSFARDWRARNGDYETFRREELRDHLAATRTHVISYRLLRDAMASRAYLSHEDRLRGGPT
jgi:predicted glycoside hydrolase/deacetylase ChbG (UPF0249 family)